MPASSSTLFGPAYKGIPIASATAVQLVEQYDVDVPWCFNRKGGQGSRRGWQPGGQPAQGAHHAGGRRHHRRHCHPRIHGSDPGQRCLLAGVLIALDRQEKGKGELSAIQEVERDYGAHIIAIIQMSDLIQYLEEKQAEQPELASQLAAMKAYRAQYGI